jgi:peptidoglycan/xylan/chitin deacetylase (PgdA/CDA1 family)
VQLKYYSTLANFESAFNSGTAILMYHKVGRRPFGARLKGLYVSPRLFERQLTELLEKGYQLVSIDAAGKNFGKPRQVVITFDDGFENVFENALPLLKAHSTPAIQFIVADLIGKRNEWDLREGEVEETLMSESQIREWISTGMQIGSHSLTHPRLSRLSVRDAREEISGSKKKLEDLFQLPIGHFCYPYGDCTPAVRDLVLEAGYATGCTTQPAINQERTDRFLLQRIMARYPSRGWKSLKSRLLQ